jgi:beta-glucosidase
MNRIKTSVPTRKRRFVVSLFLTALLIPLAAFTDLRSTRAQAVLPYKNAKLSIDERVKDLLSRMTVEEKAAQTMCLWMEKPNDNSRVPKEQLPLGGAF